MAAPAWIAYLDLGLTTATNGKPQLSSQPETVECESPLKARLVFQGDFEWMLFHNISVANSSKHDTCTVYSCFHVCVVTIIEIAIHLLSIESPLLVIKMCFKLIQVKCFHAISYSTCLPFHGGLHCITNSNLSARWKYFVCCLKTWMGNLLIRLNCE